MVGHPLTIRFPDGAAVTLFEEAAGSARRGRRVEPGFTMFESIDKVHSRTTQTAPGRTP
jgi:hypothetical protein